MLIEGAGRAKGLLERSVEERSYHLLFSGCGVRYSRVGWEGHDVPAEEVLAPVVGVGVRARVEQAVPVREVLLRRPPATMRSYHDRRGGAVCTCRRHSDPEPASLDALSWPSQPIFNPKKKLYLKLEFCLQDG